MKLKKAFLLLALSVLSSCAMQQPYSVSVKDMVDLGKVVPDEYVVELKGNPGINMDMMKGFFQVQSAGQCGKGRIYRLRHWRENTLPRAGGDVVTVTGHIECITY